MKTPTKPTKARISRVWIEHRKEDSETGIIAKAAIVSGGNVRQTLCSGGSWLMAGVSHSDLERCVKEAFELSRLRSELVGFGFGQRAIDYAMKNVERKEIS